MKDGQKLEYPIAFHTRKKDVAMVLVLGLIFIAFSKFFMSNGKNDEVDIFMLWLCFALGVWMLIAGIYAIFNNKPRYLLTDEGIFWQAFLGRRFFAWENVVSVHLDYSISRTRYGGSSKMWHCNLITRRPKQYKVKKLVLSKYKVGETELNPKEVFNLIEQSFEQYSLRNKTKEEIDFQGELFEKIDSIDKLFDELSLQIRSMTGIHPKEVSKLIIEQYSARNLDDKDINFIKQLFKDDDFLKDLSDEQSLQSIKEDLRILKEDIDLRKRKEMKSYSKTVVPLTYKKIVMTKDDYRKRSKFEEWIVFAVIIGLAVILLAAVS